MPPTQDLDLVRGTFDLLILKTLGWGPMHGLGILNWIQDNSRGSLQIEEGALYPALHRMEHRGWISAEWGVSENRRRAKYYRLTTLGRRMLRARTESWERLVSAVGKVLYTEARPA